MKTMVNNKGEILPKATIKGQDYIVLQTKRGTGGVWGAIDKIKNLTNGNVKELRRKEWKELFDKFK